LPRRQGAAGDVTQLRRGVITDPAPRLDLRNVARHSLVTVLRTSTLTVGIIQGARWSGIITFARFK